MIAANPSVKTLCIAVALLLATAGAAEEGIAMKLSPFALSDVRLSEGRFKQEQDRNQAYLHLLDNDRLLFNFRKNASLPTPGEPYGGWEAPSCEVRGHFVGHYLSACALMYASTGDEPLKAKAEALIAELAKCQQAMGGEYLSAFPESFFDRVEAAQPVWVPYYTIHKIMAGLYDMHTICGNAQALDVMKRMAAYFKKRMDKMAPDAVDRMLRTEFGGMSEVLHNLYTLTRDPQHLELAHRFDQPEFLGPLALSYDNLTRIHGNTNIPKIVGAARHYEITGDTRYRDLTSFFWDRIVQTRTYATGGSTMFECWPEANKLSQTLGHLNHETCKTYNILRVTRHLLCWTADAQYGDFYERALLNGILGTQGPRPGLLQYYVPMDAGYPRMYGTPDTAFWCCYGTGVESFSKLGDSIYFHDADGVYVNLFVPSVLEWKEKGVRIEQTAKFPEEDRTALVVHSKEPAEFAIRVRVPYWIAGDVAVTVNGQPLAIEKPKPSSWLAINQRWKDGDRVEVRLPMQLHTMPLPDDPEMVAALFGPVVLAGVLEPASRDAYVDGDAAMIKAFRKSVKPVYFIGRPDAPSEWITPVSGQPLAFEGNGPNEKVSMIPFDRIGAERYGLYWPVVAKDGARQKALAGQSARWEREIDRVFTFPGDAKSSPSEGEHALKGEKMLAGTVPGTAHCFRHAEPGGWFSWDLKSIPDQPIDLAVTYWGADVNRTFDILVDDQIVATETLKGEHPGVLFETVYPVPPEVTKGKEKVTVTFRASHDTLAGGTYGCATLRR